MRRQEFDNNWTLFLDRDGVINVKIEDDYVTSWEEFNYTDGAKEAIMRLRAFFQRIIVVTNQQCIDKGIITEKELREIHNLLRAEVGAVGGEIDKIYHCPHFSFLNCECRKPATKMAHQAKEDFPEIDFQKSIMVGDSPSDIAFAKNLGMVSVFIRNEKNIPYMEAEPDYVFSSLSEFAYFVLMPTSS